MFGSQRRREKREAAAQKAAAQRSDYWGTISEALNSSTRVVLWVGRRKIEGDANYCTIYEDTRNWSGLRALLGQVNRVRQFLGDDYDVKGEAIVSVTQYLRGLAMDYASGYDNPRTHAMDVSNVRVEVNDQRDIDEYGHAMNDVRNAWINIARR